MKILIRYGSEFQKAIHKPLIMRQFSHNYQEGTLDIELRGLTEKYTTSFDFPKGVIDFISEIMNKGKLIDARNRHRNNRFVVLSE